jgi:hypothetical protein
MVPDEGQNALTPADIGWPIGTGVAPKRLCIVSRDPHPVRAFVAALTTAVNPRDELEIIVDRRRGGSARNQTSIERRQHPPLAQALERVGVAIVPARYNLPAAPSIERFDPKDTDEHELQRIVGFKRQRRLRLNRWVILTGLTSVILVFLVHLPAMKTLMSGARPAAPPSDDRRNAPSKGALAPRIVEVVEAASPSAATTSAPAAARRSAAGLRPTTRAAATVQVSAPPSAEPQKRPPATQGQATGAPDRQENPVNDPRAVIDWLFNRSAVVGR